MLRARYIDGPRRNRERTAHRHWPHEAYLQFDNLVALHALQKRLEASGNDHAMKHRPGQARRARCVLEQLQLLNLYDGLVAQARTLPPAHCIASSCCTCVILHRPAPRLMQLRRRKWTTISWVK